MRDVQLYIGKLFASMLMDGEVSTIDITTFANAILHNCPHPNVFVSFGPAPEDMKKMIAGASDLEVFTLNGRCTYAVWVHHVDNLWVWIMFAVEDERRQRLDGSWHPYFGHKYLKIVDL